MPEFSHFNDQGRAMMVDVTEKAPTFRRAAAAGEVRVSKETLTAIREGKLKKGDVLAVDHNVEEDVAVVRDHRQPA